MDILKENYLVIEKSALPDVYEKVLKVNTLLENGEAKSTTDAVKAVGISRSVYYKYKDSVFSYKKTETSGILTVQVTLIDKPGVLANFLAVFHEVNANILTVNQNIPIRGRAFVSISARTNHIYVELDELLTMIKNIKGVVKIDSLTN